MAEPPSLAIVTTAHWDGDPRLGRHVSYLAANGVEASLISFAHMGRMASVWHALKAIGRRPASTVILPDPELFFPGSILARLRGIRPLLDIHEDYPSVVAGRRWAPEALRPAISFLARLAVRLGRWASSGVIVAAPELERAGDYVVLNVPDPDLMATLDQGTEARDTVVYVGDVTGARGAIEMIEAIALCPGTRLMVIGRTDPAVAGEIMQRASALDVEERVDLRGRMPHAEAWQAASGSLAGLNLLHDLPAYEQAVATKIWEYLAIGVPPIVSDLPGQARVVGSIDPRLVCSDHESVASVIRLLSRDPDLRDSLAGRGRDLARSRWEETRPDLALVRAIGLDR